MMKTTRRTVLSTLAAVALAHSASLAQAADSFPQRPITLVVPFAAGSATDQLARAIGQSVAQATGQSVVVENKAGAGGMLAAQYVATANPDGYTVLIGTNTTHAANPFLYKKISYDPVRSFAPLTGLGKGGQILVVPASSPYHSVADVLAAARKNPGKLTFGSGSASSRLAGEMLKQLAKVDILHIPYKSNPMAVTDLIGGQIDMMVPDTATGLPHVQSGKLRALAYSTAPRNALLPHTPTMVEAGVEGYDMSYWFAAYAPAGTPSAVVARLNALLAQGVRSEAATNFFRNTGAQAWTSTPEELAQFQAKETQKWGDAIGAAGIQPE